MGAAICVGLCVFLSVCRVVVRHRFAEPLLFEATARQVSSPFPEAVGCHIFSEDQTHDAVPETVGFRKHGNVPSVGTVSSHP